MRVAAAAISTLAAILACGSGEAAAQGPGQAPSRAFDGSWNVVVVCSTSADGARGYTWRFPATIANGVLHGQYGIADTPSSMALDGRIAPDGSALLFAYGQTGNPAYAVRRVQAASPFQYHVRTQFTAGHGDGTRLELRPCTLTFDRS